MVEMNRKMVGKVFAFVILLFLLNIILITEVAAAEDCAGKRIGLVGASNTWDIADPKTRTPLVGEWSNAYIIKQLCPGATVFLNAEGGKWPGAQVYLVKAVLQNDNLDYVILDPSANGQQTSSSVTPEAYKKAAIDLAQLVKDKNNAIKVIMLTNTPTKGAAGGYGTPEAIQRIKAFNADLLNNKLGRSDLIDDAVDTYSVIESSPGSDTCGYCGNDKGGLGDGIHFGPAGRKQVMKTVMDTIAASSPSNPQTSPATTLPTTTSSSGSSAGSSASSPSSSTSTPSLVLVPVGAAGSTSTTTTVSCQSQACKEIDQVWLQIVAWINNLHVGQIWDGARGWISYKETLPSAVLAPTAPGVGVAIKQTIKNVAEAEWEKWSKGTKTHADANMRSTLDSYYAAATTASNSCPPGSNPDNIPWSASFISYVVKQAGVADFPVNCAHSGYFNSLRSNPGVCRTYPMSEKSKISVGDIVCHCRLTPAETAAGKTECSNDYNNPSTYGHCDVVVNVLGNNQLEVIGGNVGKTVSKRTVDVSTEVVTSSTSVVSSDRKWYGFISCGEAAVAGVQPTGDLCVATTGTPEERALLDTIGWAEATGSRYDMVAFGQFVAEKDPSNPYKKDGNLNLFSSYSSHPHILIKFKAGECTGDPRTSACTTAAGRYQFLYRKYLELKNKNCDKGCFKTGFGPKEQDDAALKLAVDSGVTDATLKYAEAEGNFISVWDKLAPTWASLPSSAHGGGSALGQGSKSTSSLQEHFMTCLRVQQARLGISSSVASTTSAAPATPSVAPGVPATPSVPSTPSPSSTGKPLGGGIKTVQDLSPTCTIPAENKGKSESSGVAGCPAGMVKVANFCVDRFEGTLVNKGSGDPWSPYCSPGKGNAINDLKAVSLAGVVPQGYISGDQAALACQNAGKHLCTQKEWLTACQGNTNNKFPYGNAEVPTQCNYGRAHPDVKTAEAPNAKYDLTDPQVNKNYALSITGNFGNCATPQGAFDMTGNLQEWVNDGSGANHNLFGGGYYGATLQQVIQQPLSGVGCGFQVVGHPSNHFDYSLGFRCCANPS